MSRSLKDSGRRRSFFSRTPSHTFSPISDSNPMGFDPRNTLKKRRTSAVSAHELGLGDRPHDFRDGNRSDSPPRQQMSSRGSSARPSSLLGSLRSLRNTDDYEEPLSATSSKSPLGPLNETSTGVRWSKTVVCHGEVQTSSSMFRKKKEYLVLTETHMVRAKNQQKAADVFSSVPSPLLTRTPNMRHASSPSVGSAQDHHSHPSESSGERDVGSPLRHVIAVYLVEDGRPYFAIEIALLDDANNTHTMMLQFSAPGERDKWLRSIRSAANRARLLDLNPFTQRCSEFAARVVEREGDYEPPNYEIYKVLQRPSGKMGPRSSAEDITRDVPMACFLAIGAHKVHLIPVPKFTSRTSSPSLNAYNSHESFGILTLTHLRLNDSDDSFDITFRLPLERARTLHLASLASHDVAVRLRQVDDFLRPEWETRPYTYSVPQDVKKDIISTPTAGPLDQDTLDRTLIAYCIAYNMDPGNIRYQVTYPHEDGPRFELLKPVETRRPHYTALELLAVMRALRYNESFGGISFADVALDALNGLYDRYGKEHVCIKTKRGTPVGLSTKSMTHASLLVQEIRALAISSKRLRRMDFTGSITRMLPESAEGGDDRVIGCGIVEALFPLCQVQSTNVDWIILNKIQLSEGDLDYVISGAAQRDCHLRALGLSGCGLTDRSLSFALEALRAQDNTLEAIDISGNTARLSPSVFGAQIGVFGFIRKLDLSNVSRTSGPEPLLTAEVMMTWRLQELNLSGTHVNAQTVEALACYLASPQSQTLRELLLEHTYISGKDIAVLMRAMTQSPGETRTLHLDVSQNHMEADHKYFSKAIAEGYAPAHLTIRMMEYVHEKLFRELILAFAANRTIKSLNISQASLPCDACQETCLALEKMFADNHTLEMLDISGADSRLETTKLGVGINRALCGLKRNDTLRVLYIQNQRLGPQGASTLADVLKVNTTLRELHCEHNGIMLSAFTDLINALHRNTTLMYLPPMTESREAALHETEQTVKSVRDEQPHTQPHRDFGGSGVRRLLAASRVTRAASTASGFSTSLAHKPAHSTPLLSDADIRAAMTLVDESWGRQLYRLQLYLQRNHNIAHGIPTNMEVDEEDFERPGTAASLSRLIERVQFDRTPTEEATFVIYDSGDSRTSGSTARELPAQPGQPANMTALNGPENIPPSPIRSPPALEL